VYLDDLPDAAIARQIKAAARGQALTENGRAVGVAFVADGYVVPATWIVRFDIAEGSDGRKLLREAFAATAAETIWYFGGDTVTRQAVNDLGLESTPHLGLFVRRADPATPDASLYLSGEPQPDAQARAGISAHVRHYPSPRFAAAIAGSEIVGYAILQELTPIWSEVSAFVFPSVRGHGYGAEILSKAADAAENTGRLVCAAAPYEDTISRKVLESAGFRLADYYFVAKIKRF
jgi:RimJ/RimL family protein N-acetyltransferase